MDGMHRASCNRLAEEDLPDLWVICWAARFPCPMMPPRSYHVRMDAQPEAWVALLTHDRAGNRPGYRQHHFYSHSRGPTASGASVARKAGLGAGDDHACLLLFR